MSLAHAALTRRLPPEHDADAARNYLDRGGGGGGGRTSFVGRLMDAARGGGRGGEGKYAYNAGQEKDRERREGGGGARGKRVGISGGGEDKFPRNGDRVVETVSVSLTPAGGVVSGGEGEDEGGGEGESGGGGES